jgi:tRNA A58 N-methylase Trm61
LSLSDEQYAVQDLVNRKVTSYYTSKDGVAVVRVFVKSIGRGDGVVVMGPSLGSGVLLPSNSNLIRPGKVVGIEINEEPCNLARRILTKLYTNVEVVCGGRL